MIQYENSARRRRGGEPDPEPGRLRRRRRGDESGPIVLGASLPLTGPLGTFGPIIQDAYERAVDDINEAGGVDVDGTQRQLELVVKDNKSDPTQVTSTARSLIIDDEAVALLGSVTPPLTIPLSVVADQERIPVLTSLTPTQAWLAGNPDGWQYAYDVYIDEVDQTAVNFQASDLVQTNKRVALFTDTAEDGAGDGRSVGEPGGRVRVHHRLPRGVPRRDDGLQPVHPGGEGRRRRRPDRPGHPAGRGRALEADERAALLARDRVGRRRAGRSASRRRSVRWPRARRCTGTGRRPTATSAGRSCTTTSRRRTARGRPATASSPATPWCRSWPTRSRGPAAPIPRPSTRRWPRPRTWTPSSRTITIGDDHRAVIPVSALQWQGDAQVTVWPEDQATGTLEAPAPGLVG